MKRTRTTPKDPQLVTMLQIAQHAGVSLSTVSRVLSNTVPVTEEKRASVLNAVEALGYRPHVIAQELASGHSKAVGVLCEGMANAFQSGILRGVELGLLSTGYWALFASRARPAEQTEGLAMLLSHRAEALIVIGCGMPDEELARMAARVPLVAIARTIRGLEHRCIRVRNREAAESAVGHLVGLGHKRIAHITGYPDHPDSIDRREGYAAALAASGITVSPALVRQGAWNEESGLRCTEALLEAGTTFTAIFASNDQMAFGAGLALFRRGLRVPQDVSIVGFDDLPGSAYTWPPLTTMRQPAEEMGTAASRALVAELRGEPPVLPTFDAALVLRDSTGPPSPAPPRRR
jgi:LacI family transcriptional regulator